MRIRSPGSQRLPWLVFLLLMISCAMLTRPRVNLLTLSMVLFLFAQTSIWGAGFAALMFASGAAVAIAPSRELRARTWEMVTGAVIVLAGEAFGRAHTSLLVA